MIRHVFDYIVANHQIKMVPWEQFCNFVERTDQHLIQHVSCNSYRLRLGFDADVRIRQCQICAAQAFTAAISSTRSYRPGRKSHISLREFLKYC